MELDRLAEVKKKAGLGARGDIEKGKVDGKPKKDESNKDISDHMRLYDKIKEDLGVIRRNVAMIEKLKDQERTTVNEQSRKAIMKELDGLMRETTAHASRIKEQLDKIKKENQDFKKLHGGTAAITQMRINLYQTHLRRFHQTMNSFNQASHDFKKALKDRTRRQLQIVDQDLSEEQLDRIVEEGNAQEVIHAALISEDLDNVVAEIEERHQDIIKLEKQVHEVYELFRDMAALVDLQQESLDVIENRVTTAKDYTERAVNELHQAEEYQLKARKRACCIAMILLGILCAVLIPIIATQLGDA